MGENATIAVLGSGSWGATIAAMLHTGGHRVRLWCHGEEERAALLECGHPPGVPELKLPELQRITTSLVEALRGADAAVFVIPSQATAALCTQIASEGLAPPLAIIASKGIDAATLRPLTTILEDTIPQSVLAVVSGPCIAREVARGVPTSVVAASSDPDAARAVQRWFHSPRFRVYRQDDVLGVELGGALKNVIAIAAGISDGMGFGANSKSALLTRGLAEMTRLAVALGARESTIAGLAGLGDLCVTCFSPHSRNRRFGEALGGGQGAEEAIRTIGEVVEGLPTARAVLRLCADRGLEAPIAEVVVRIADKEWSTTQALEWLMQRELKEEF